MCEGKVYIVGAGPGDPRLVTLRAVECLKKAEVLVYDRLVHPSLLGYVPPGAEKIFVGKEPQIHALPQEDINQLLVEKARQGKVVVRLKGGDPFVFGRGGEEAGLLSRESVPFEIVPGVTSAVAVPAYAGIPVTHRDYTSSFSVITGHEEEGKGETAIDWDGLARGRETLVFLMGVRNLRHIIGELVSRGKDPQTPAALIRLGTFSRQKTLQGTLENLGEKAQKSNFKPPAVLVVGEVVSLRPVLKWWEKKLLFGRAVVITRPFHLQESFQNQVIEMGGEPVNFPVLEIQPPQDYSDLDRALEGLASFQWIIFTSINGVEYFFRRLEEKKIDIRELKGIRVAAIGPKTSDSVRQRGIKVEFQPAEYRTEAVASGIRKYLSPGDRVLLPRADIATPLLAQALKDAGMEVVEATTYLNKSPRQVPEVPWEEITSGPLKPVITFTSSSTVRNFFQLLGEEKGKGIARKSLLASIGPVTSDTIRSYGLEVDIEAKRYTMEGLLVGILRFLKNENRED